MSEKRFSLFNVSRWRDNPDRPFCCGVVPVLYEGMFDTEMVDYCLDILKRDGSVAAPGFLHPEGVVVFHVAANVFFKKTLEHDSEGKRK